MAERPNAPVLKTGDTKVSVGSNPTPSARLLIIGYGNFYQLVREIKNEHISICSEKETDINIMPTRFTSTVTGNLSYFLK